MSFSKFKKTIKIKLNQNQSNKKEQNLYKQNNTVFVKKIKYILKIKYKKEDSFQKIII